MYLKSSWTQTHSSMKRKKSREIIFPLKLYKASRSLLLKNWSDIVSAPDTTIYWSGNKYLFRILIAPLSNENLLPSVEVIAYVFHRKGNQRFSYRHVYEKLNTANITLVATCACFVTEPWQVCHLNWVTEVVLIHIYIYIKSSVVLPLCEKWRKSNPNAYIYGDWTFQTDALFLRNCLYNNLGFSLVSSVLTLRVALDARQQVSLLRCTFCVKVLMYKQAVQRGGVSKCFFYQNIQPPWSEQHLFALVQAKGLGDEYQLLYMRWCKMKLGLKFCASGRWSKVGAMSGALPPAAARA